jgi:hypothetical protein
VSPWLDWYNNLAAKFPQVKFVASWTLQSGYAPVDSQILTWLQYPINKQFNAGPQPAPTDPAFGGTLPTTPTDPTNLLLNPSFEKNSYVYNNIQEVRVPDDWGFWFAPASIPNPYDANPWSVWRQPESRLMTKADLPVDEENLFIKDGNKTWKVFKGNGSMWFYLRQTLNPGKYKLTLGIFPDVVVGYQNDQKVFADDPNSCIVWIETPTGNTAPQRPTIGAFNYLTFTFNMEVAGNFKVHVQQPFATQNNGAFLDNHNLEEIIDTMPITQPAKINHTIHLLPQDTTLLELNKVTTELHPTRSAFSYSADLVHTVLFSGNENSKVVIWDGDRWPGGLAGITKWFNDRGIVNLEFRDFGGSSAVKPF